MAFPDVCKTPAPPAPFVPIPYPNMSMVNGSDGSVSQVTIAGKDSLVLTSYQSSSKGDEAGTLKGMISMTNMDRVSYRMGSMKVFIKGKPAVRVTSMTAHNGMNANMPAGVQGVPSQAKVFVP